MTPSDLDARLRNAAPPDPGPVFWHEFASQVTARILRTPWTITFPSPPRSGVRWARAVGMALGLLVVVPALRFHPSPRPSTPGPDLLATCFDQAAALFPGRLRSIVEDGDGLRMDLAETSTFVGGPRVLLTICGPSGCARFVTSSGQQIPIANLAHDVLVDGHGAVLVAGPRVLWSSATPDAVIPGFRIEARILEPRS